MNRILVFGDDEAAKALSVQLRALGVHSTSTSCPQTAELAQTEGAFDAVIAPMAAFTAGGVLSTTETHRFGVAEVEERDIACAELGQSIDDCLFRPITTEQVALAIARSKLYKTRRTPGRDAEIIGMNQGLAAVWKTASKVARHDTDVLLTGESGTGKELFARAIHQMSEVAGPFVAINCAAIPQGLMESELFGHVKGAFTDAHSDKEGVFRRAHGGTLFLDEIGDFPLEMQVKLLRVLQAKEVCPVGSGETLPVQVRLISATSRDVQAMVKAGTFREDLYYRIAVIPIALPPLRDRTQDLDALVAHFLAAFNSKHGKSLTLSVDAGALLKSCQWPGNVRQLKNALERLVLLADSTEIGAELVAHEMQISTQDLEDEKTVLAASTPSLQGRCLRDALHFVEAKLIEEALIQCDFKRANSAKLLCISPRTLLYKIKEHKLQNKGMASL